MSKGAAAANKDSGIPASNTPMPTLASDTFLVDDDGDGVDDRLVDPLYGGNVRQPRGEAAARKAAFRRLAAQSAAMALGTAHDDDDADTAANARGDGDGAAFKSVNPHQRTVLEQAILDRVPGRIQANLTRPQVVGGKQYKGAGFLAEPSAIVFRDFTVGKPMSTTVTMTNISNGFNVFKVGKLPAAIVDCIEVSHVPTGLLSAGLSSKITITFTPKEDTDIDADIPLLAQTGPLTVPLQCRRQRSVVTVSSKVVDFDTVVIAEKRSRKLTFRNDGARPTTVTLRGEQLLAALKMTQTPPPEASTQAAALAMSPCDPAEPSAGDSTDDASRKKVGQPAAVPILTLTPGDKALTGLFIPAFGSASVTLTFSPFAPCELDVDGFLTFDSNDVPDQPFFVRAAAVDVPVFIDENATVDLGCCCDGTMYRQKFSVRNTTTASAHVKPEVPPLLRGLVDFVPPFGFVQPRGEPLEFQVRFIPNAGKLDQNKARLSALAEAALERRRQASSDGEDELDGQSNADYIDELTSGNDYTTTDAESRMEDDADNEARLRDDTPTADSPTKSRNSSPRATSRNAASAASGNLASTTATAAPGESSAAAAVRPTICTDDQLQVPIRVRVLGQAMPLYVTLVAGLSARRLVVEPAEGFHFSGLSPAESLTRKLSLTNDTRLFRYVGFVKVPPNIEISPPSSKVRLAPGEKYTVDVRVHPPEAAAAGLAAADSFRQQLQVLTEHGEAHLVPVSGTVRTPPLRFSAAHVSLPACAINDTVSATVNLTNVSNEVRCFSFAKVLKRHGLRVMPQSGELLPGQSVALVVSFEAHPAVAFPVVVPSEPAPDEADAGRPSGASPAEASPTPTGGKPAGKPAAKKKSKAEEEAERRAAEEAEAARQAELAAREKARQAALEELKHAAPWECSQTGPSEAQEVAREEAIIAALRRDAERANDAAATTHQEPELTTTGEGRGTVSPRAAAKADVPVTGPTRPEMWSRHRTVRLPCFIQNWAGHAIFLAVRITAVEPCVIATPSAVLPTVTSEASEAANAATSAPAAVVSSGSVVVDSMLTVGSLIGSSGGNGESAAAAAAKPNSGNNKPSTAGAGARQGALTPEVVSRSLSAISLSGTGAPLTSGMTVDFGSVPALAKAKQVIHLHCVRRDGMNDALRLSVAAHDPYGPFTVVRPPTAVSDAGQRCELVLLFRPRQKAVYQETLRVLVGDRHCIMLSCRGEGLPTSLTVSMDAAAASSSSAKQAAPAAGKGGAGAAAAKAGPAAAAAAQQPTDGGDKAVPGAERIAGDGVATVDGDLGNCIIGEQTESPISFQNTSPFPLNVSVEFVQDTVQPRNPNGLAPFVITPSSFVLPANGRVDGSVTFRPMCAAAFTATAFVSYGGAESMKRVCLSGFGRAKGAYLRFPAQSNALMHQLATTPAPAEVPIPVDGGTSGADDGGIATSRPTTSEMGTRPPTREDAGQDARTPAVPAEVFRPRFAPLSVLGDAPPAVGTTSANPIEVFFASQATPDAAGNAAGAAGKGGGDPTSAPVAEPVSRSIVVGTVPTSSSAEVTVEGLTDADTRAGWRVDAPKLSVPSGQKAQLTLTFAPTVQVLNMLPLRNVAVVSTANVRLTLKGGSPASDSITYVRLVGSLTRP